MLKLLKSVVVAAIIVKATNFCYSAEKEAVETSTIKRWPDSSYYKPSYDRMGWSIIDLKKELESKSNLLFVDLHGDTTVDDEVIRWFCNTEIAKSVVNLDLSGTAVTSSCLQYLVSGKLGTTSNSPQIDEMLGVPVREVYVILANTGITQEDIAPYTMPLPIEVTYNVKSDAVCVYGESEPLQNLWRLSFRLESLIETDHRIPLKVNVAGSNLRDPISSYHIQFYSEVWTRSHLSELRALNTSYSLSTHSSSYEKKNDF